MTALPSPDFQHPVQTKSFHRNRRRLSTQKSVRQQPRRHGILRQQRLVAAVGKLVVYSLLFTLGLVSFVKMVNYNFTQQTKLHLLKSEVKDAKQRTQLADEDFQRSFDPHIAKELMQESSYKVAPDQKPIKIYTPEYTKER